jgi:hypothetical protein
MIRTLQPPKSAMRLMALFFYFPTPGKNSGRLNTTNGKRNLFA